MTTKTLGLLLLLSVILLGVAKPSTSQTGRDPFAETIDGTWIVEPNLVGGTPGIQQLTTYMRGNILADGNAMRPTLRSPWHGTYVRRAYRDFAGTMVRWNFDDAGNFTGRTEELQAIVVAFSQDEFSGNLKQLTFDASGNLVRTREGTLRGRRMTVKAID